MSATHATGIRCYRCGADLARLTLPIARLDLCPDCGVELHVCRMCSHYLPSVPAACTEEDAEEIHEKTRANFCEFYAVSAQAFDGAERAADVRARDQLAALFGSGRDESRDGGSGVDRDASGEDAPAPDEDPLAKARALFDR